MGCGCFKGEDEETKRLIDPPKNENNLTLDYSPPPPTYDPPPPNYDPPPPKNDSEPPPVPKNVYNRVDPRNNPNLKNLPKLPDENKQTNNQPLPQTNTNNQRDIPEDNKQIHNRPLPNPKNTREQPKTLEENNSPLPNNQKDLPKLPEDNKNQIKNNRPLPSPGFTVNRPLPNPDKNSQPTYTDVFDVPPPSDLPPPPPQDYLLRKKEKTTQQPYVVRRITKPKAPIHNTKPLELERENLINQGLIPRSEVSTTIPEENFNRPLPNPYNQRELPKLPEENNRPLPSPDNQRELPKPPEDNNQSNNIENVKIEVKQDNQNDIKENTEDKPKKFIPPKGFGMPNMGAMLSELNSKKLKKIDSQTQPKKENEENETTQNDFRNLLKKRENN